MLVIIITVYMNINLASVAVRYLKMILKSLKKSTQNQLWNVESMIEISGEEIKKNPVL